MAIEDKKRKDFINYKNFGADFITKFHGQIYNFRKLYKGRHVEVFARAKQMVEEGDAIDTILTRSSQELHAPSPYMVMNVCKMIINTPAILVGRSIGDITSGLEGNEQQSNAANTETSNQIDGVKKGTKYSTDIIEVQNELIKNIVARSKLKHGHKMYIVQQQMDGGIVGVPWDDHKGLRIEFKARDVYFPHEDEMGADLAYMRTIDEEEYLHVYRERLERDDNGDPYLETQHMLFQHGAGSLLTDEPIPEEEAAELLNMDVEDMFIEYPGRTELFIRYWANDPTLIDPLGVSAIEGMENRQDEINFTLTETARIFVRNGKPRLAINKELAKALTSKMNQLYGPQGAGRFDHELLEVVSMDDNGNSMEIIQIDVSKLGGMDWVKDTIKSMLMETQTSEKAVDFYMGEDQAGAQSGVAKFYDLFLSLMKAEEIQKQYIDFIKDLVEDALWLANYSDPSVEIEKPNILLNGMLPIERKELVEENMLAFGGESAQSLETTIRLMNPGWSDERVDEEMATIEAARVKQNSDTIKGVGRTTWERMTDNQDTRPQSGNNPPAPDNGQE